MIFPSKRLALLALLPLVSSFFLVPFPNSHLFLYLANGVFFGVLFFDLFMIPKKSWFKVSRDGQKIHALEHEHTHTVFVDVRASYKVQFDCWVHKDEDVIIQDLPITADERQARLEFFYKVKPMKRGRIDSNWVKLNVCSRFGFWRRILQFDEPATYFVYPNFKRLEDLALLAKTNREFMVGVRKIKKIGGDQEFESLRDYVQGDELRTIDWKASAKRRGLMVRNYQPEENQSVIFLLDCGRLMHTQHEGVTLLDRTLNAMLLLSYVALKQGDRVGFLAFSSEVHRMVPAKRGTNHLQSMIHASFDLFSDYSETHFDSAFQRLTTHFRKRSLVILFTQVVDDVNTEQIQKQLKAISHKHLPLCVHIQDPGVHQFFDQPPHNRHDFYNQASAASLLDWQRKVLTNFKHQGSLVLEAFPDHISSKLINQYLEIKARHLL